MLEKLFRGVGRQRARGGYLRPVSVALLVAVVVPVVAVTAARGRGPRTYVMGAPSPWQQVQASVRARSSIELFEDFSPDLRHWAGSAGLPSGWRTDSSGFTHPGYLALYINSVPLTNYRVDFLASIERESLNFVYRALDFDNYYVARITIVRPDLIPEVALERYVVLNGQAGPVTHVKLPFAVRMDTLYAVQVTAQGDQFITRINDQIVDNFSDSRLRSGGVGFFSVPGESASIHELRMVDQDDTLGKLCAWLVPRFSL
jgi:hypothetical protein